MSSSVDDGEREGQSNWSDYRQAWVPAIVISALVHAGWALFALWYLKFPDSTFCSRPGEGGLWGFPECPEPRPAAGTVAFVTLLGGLVAGTVVPASLTDIDLYDPWTWIVFAVLVPVGMVIVGFALLILVLGIA